MDPRRLRDETRTEHEATEALLPLTGNDLTPDLYARALHVLLPIVQGWERWASAAAPEPLRPLLPPRRRAHLLQQDIRAFPIPEDLPPPHPIDWPAVLSTPSPLDPDPGQLQATFLGALYVMEGSTLGGRYIARHVEPLLGLTPGIGDAYFRGHGEATGALWRDITARISAVPDEHAPILIATARRTFTAFGDALRVGLYAPMIH